MLYIARIGTIEGFSEGTMTLTTEDTEATEDGTEDVL